MMHADHARRTVMEAVYTRLHCQYDRLHATLDDQWFHQSAIHILETIHATLRAGDVPPDLTAAYQQLERLTRAQIARRHLLPNRLLF